MSEHQPDQGQQQGQQRGQQPPYPAYQQYPNPKAAAKAAKAYAKATRPWYRKKRVIIPVAALAVVGGIAIGTSGGGEPASETVAHVAADGSATKAGPAPQAGAGSKPESATKSAREVPVEYEAALASAESYLDLGAFSKAGLTDQLTSEYGEQFSADAARYAVNHVDVDWNEEALESAESYMELSPMSPEGLRDQLTSEYGEQFTPQQADYAVQHVF